MGHGHGHGHQRGHQANAPADRRLLSAALAVLVAFLIGEVIVAWVTGSLVLLSDAGHMLSDVAAIVVALVALSLADRPAAGAWTFGWKRAEILAALANAVTLLAFAAIIIAEAIRRLVTSPPEVDAWPVLIVAIVGVGVNLIATVLIARANRSSLNIEGAYQHLLTDLYGFLGTAAAAIIILTTGWEAADAVASLLVAGLMLRAGWPLLRASVRVLMEAAPGHLALDEIRDHLLGVDHVLDVHDLHVWELSSDLPTLSAHLVVDESCFTDGHAPQILDQVQACLGEHFDLTHSTFQIEPPTHATHEDALH